QFFGTHRLRTLDINQAAEEGLGDADFVRLENLAVSAEYQIGDALHSTDKDIVVFPLLDPNLGDEQPRKIHFIGWSNVFDPNCHDRQDCYATEFPFVQGLVRPPNPRKTPTDSSWAAMGFELAEDVRYLQINREPMAWYWNLLLFLGGIGLPLAVEARAYKQKQAA
ncbi:MAG: hypothetical protein AAGF87_16370, partial [Bacteroidota bacterium]